MIGKCMVALITPFTSMNTVDVLALKELVVRLLQDGVDGFVVCGTTAEVSTLSYEERELVVDTVIEVVQGRVPIWVGCGTNCTWQSLVYMQQVEHKQIDGIMLVTPYYNCPSQEGLFAHFFYLANHTKHDVMLYNVPKRTGITLMKETMERLIVACRNIKAIKQASADFLIAQSNIVKEHQVKVFCGDDALLLECLQSGGYGIISVVGHISCSLIKKIIEGYNNGLDVINEDLKLKDQARMIFLEGNPCGIKYVLSRKKWIQPYVRLPLFWIVDETKVVLDAFFD